MPKRPHAKSTTKRRHAEKTYKDKPQGQARSGIVPEVMDNRHSDNLMRSTHDTAQIITDGDAHASRDGPETVRQTVAGHRASTMSTRDDTGSTRRRGTQQAQHGSINVVLELRTFIE